MRQTMNENWKFVKYAENMSEAVGAAGEHVDLRIHGMHDGQDRRQTIITAASVGM